MADIGDRGEDGDEEDGDGNGRDTRGRAGYGHRGESEVGRMLKRYEEESQAFIMEKVVEWEATRGARADSEDEDELAAEGGMEGIVGV